MGGPIRGRRYESPISPNLQMNMNFLALFRATLVRRSGWWFFGAMLALVVGTLMPGYWRDAFERALVPSAVPLSSIGHVLCFVVMAAAARLSPRKPQLWQVLLGAILLGALTEGLQHFAVQRHPRLLDVGYDVLGACIGLWLAAVPVPSEPVPSEPV